MRTYLQAQGISGISLRSAGEALHADYTSSAVTHRQDSLAMMQSALQSAKDDGMSLLVSKGNRYTLPYATTVVDLPLRSDRYVMTDYSVPFMAMVLSGRVDYTSGAINLSNDSQKDLLRLVENAASPYCVLTATSTVGVDVGDYSNLYATAYDDQKEKLIDAYEWLREGAGTYYGQRFLSHQRLADNVYRSVFSNGSVVVNYNDYAVMVDGTEIEAYGYWISGNRLVTCSYTLSQATLS